VARYRENRGDQQHAAEVHHGWRPEGSNSAFRLSSHRLSSQRYDYEHEAGQTGRRRPRDHVEVGPLESGS
jgi:hypothetical protein